MPIYHLELRGALHVGEAVSVDRETVLEWLPSDSLFSALVTAWASNGDDVEGRLNLFEHGESPFRITSAFPYVHKVRFFPAPAALPESLGLIGKDAKRVKWLSNAVFEQLRTGNCSTKESLHSGTVWVTPDEHECLTAKYLNDEGQVRLWQTFVVPRVTVDRVTNASNLFHAGRVSFAKGDGLWFASRGAQTEWITDALARLADTGLGGLRNYGHGAFKFEQKDDPFPDSPTSGAGISLSRYAPRDADEIRATLKADGAGYRLVTVGGWCNDDAGHAWRRRSVRMLAEGAILLDVSSARGNLVRVQPDNVPEFQTRKVYRYGIPFFVSAGKFAEGVRV